MNRYGGRGTRPYYKNETKHDLIEKNKRLLKRIAVLESHITAPFLRIRNAIRKWKKDKKNKGVTVLMFAIVEQLYIITKNKPLTPGNTKTMWMHEDGETVYESKETAEAQGLDAEALAKLKKVYETSYFNCVNMFFSRESAEEHLEEHHTNYTRPKIVTFTPVENKEVEKVIKHFQYLGENIPGSMDIFTENEELKLKNAQHEETQATLDTVREQLKQTDEELEKVKADKENLMKAINIKKGK